ncbi:hypothetical protein [Carnimonas bestiolae]|uniref:hypothetical protein n=1 Tax=Carnimonas bestiolae TaxID=3402172 RepID=UPI003F4AF7B4
MIELSRTRLSLPVGRCVMKALLLSALAAMLVPQCQATPSSESLQQHSAKAQTVTLIIYHQAGVDRRQLIKAIERFDGSVVYQLDNMHALVVRLPANKAKKAAHDLRQRSEVLSVLPDRMQPLSESSSAL